jgi:hypothetical protein
MADAATLIAFRLIEEGGLVVARVECRDADRARSEIDHYARMYAQDCKVAVQERAGKRWKLLYILAPVRAALHGGGG